MYDTFELPYFRDAGELPSALPTIQEIEGSTTKLSSFRDPRYGQVVHVKRYYIVKYGVLIDENEGFALFFIEKMLNIPSPRLLAMFRDNGKVYIVMDRIPGFNLGTVWSTFTEAEKNDVASQLRHICQSIRSLPSPGYFGSLDGSHLRHRFFRSASKDPKITGPFNTEAEVGRALALRSRENSQDNLGHGWMSDFFERHLPGALAGHPSTFTHADLHPQNILVKRVEKQDGVSEGRIKVTGIVDWELAGWYPSYWEYASSFVDFSWGDDWPEAYEKIVTPRPLEAAMLKMLRQDLEY